MRKQMKEFSHSGDNVAKSTHVNIFPILNSEVLKMSDYRLESDSEDEIEKLTFNNDKGKRKIKPDKLINSKRLKPSAARAVAEANEKFLIDLLRLVDGKKSVRSGNTVISPMSLSTVLALLKTGASGTSDNELEETLHLPFDAETINRGYKELLTSLQVDRNRNDSNGFTLHAANGIYVDKKYKLKNKFVESAKSNFFAAVKKLDFTNPQAAAAQINKWVGNSTNKRITKAISAKNFTRLTAVVLVNVLYLKAKWSQPFNEILTERKPFHISNEEEKQVQMMHKKSEMFYTAEKKLKAGILRLDYKADKAKQKCSMLIYLPDKDSSVEDLKKTLHEADVSSVLKNMEKVRVDLSMPKFRMDMSHNLVPVLKKLGLVSIFSDKTADLKDIGEDVNGLYVTSVIQQVYISVGEKGTEAAAVSNSEMASRCKVTPPPLPKVKFEVNRPFIFQIVNRDLSLILFSGVCSNPILKKT